MSLGHIQVSRRSFVTRLNWYLILSIIAIHAIGLLNLHSATLNIAPHLKNVFHTQTMWLSIGWCFFFLLTLIDYKIFIKLAPLIYALNILALVAVMFVGKKSLGAQRWIDLGFFRYQPSETMKLAIILMLARVLAKYPTDRGLDFKDLLIPAGVLGLPFILTFKQPDLGTALLLLMIGGALILAMKVKKRVLLTALIVTCVTLPLAWKFALKPYQKNRVMTLLNPGKDPRGKDYNSIQARIAVGSGKIFGKGFTQGSQSQLEFLPEKHTDFIFCVLSEEHGFLGSIATLGLFAILLIAVLQCSFLAKDLHGALLGVGVFSMILFHVFVNIGMVIGLLPIVGAPLPLISYGGSSNLAMMVALGWGSSVFYRKDMF